MALVSFCAFMIQYVPFHRLSLDRLPTTMVRPMNERFR